MSETPRFVEVSHQVVAGMKTYPGLPVPQVEVLLDYETSYERYGGKSEFLIASLHLCGNTGTYVDSPVHRFRGAADLAALPLERLAHVPVQVLDARQYPTRGIGRDAFEGLDVRGRAVLVRTDWSRRWGQSDYFDPNPFLDEAACALLVEQGVVFVGIDSVNIDDMADLARPAHTRLLGAGVPICEHMTNLHEVPAAGGRLHAVPIAWRGGATFPVRAYVLTEGSVATGAKQA
jgi:arylformamidase